MSMERIKPTRSGLFAIELLIAVGVFSLCAAICVDLFVRSEVMSQDSADLNRAVTEARSAAECFKAVGGDLEKTAELTGGKSKPLDKVGAVYNYVVHSLTYDRAKAASVTSGYLPDLDSVLASRTGICFDYASLMTGMLRSQGF